ncbi:HPr family phosphocarrier protein [Mycoplasma sp. Mirounga ES2805-ORL]|uniref:HPr family phosphocarrier protein n=1 Tax=Mycoplasma sp. Mirounga ES2805-ORL TaxID=754514 RepID=UPI00197B90CD|nr:HPr family phosphocarrier protein [Mycoplasma sp. Mirounga ES2805-ORL]QSF13924.1 HPr family phosphocarrier protein [Mycoplasma sp. Mirounga ES2805-ORL]
MKSFTAKIIDNIGLHAGPASIVSAAAYKFRSDIFIKTNTKESVGNLKSIMNVMALDIHNGDIITVEANGIDEEEAIATLEDIFKKNNLI